MSYRRRKPRRAQFASIVRLESRRLLSSSLSSGVLTITGGSGNDQFTLRYALGQQNMTVTENGTPTSYIYADVVEIQADLGDGNDSLDGQTTITKPMTLHGGAGNDTLRGGNGSDDINGDDGDDVMLGRLGADSFSGGAGVDTIDYTDRTSGNPNLTITVDDTNDDGVAGEHDNVGSDIERILAGVGNDYIQGNASDNYIDPGNGNDTIVAGAGNDTIIGGVGADDDDGGDGIDTIDYTLFASALRITLDGSANDLEGAGSENVRGTIEVVIGGSGADSITGNSNNETLIGNGGNDTLLGGDGDDSLDGGLQSDLLDGGNGNDILVGGKGSDILIGSAGADTFYSGGDGSIDTLYFQLGMDSLGSSDITDLIIPV